MLVRGTNSIVIEEKAGEFIAGFFFGIRAKREVRINYPLIIPEKPDEFDGLPVDLILLIRRVRSEKAELRMLERERAVIAGSAGQEVLDGIDRQIAELDASRVVLLHRSARLVPGYSIALRNAVENIGFVEDVGTVRYYKRRDGCFTFGMPGMDTVAVWVARDDSLVRAEPIDR